MKTFAVIPSIDAIVRSVHAYSYVLASIDGMTANVFILPQDLILHVSSRIINEVTGINRVTFDYTSKPPGTIEWE
jgi:GMP synthase (glutamine-hydrolysing)